MNPYIERTFFQSKNANKGSLENPMNKFRQDEKFSRLNHHNPKINYNKLTRIQSRIHPVKCNNYFLTLY